VRAKLLTGLGQHGNAVLFLVGFALFEAGLLIYSRPLAAVVGGGLLMTIAAWPYLWLKGLR
jgi:hypothetical protein